ncbi:putative UMP/CMP kinase 4 [Ananas comosus]|uniref:UMP-CMP kinase n=1 Tax=Ananas comosus TaxID=4615 RepID=A0A199UGH0_ANACO|nr:putative UMP/CMP kinase 4 [Ananas comosus]
MDQVINQNSDGSLLRDKKITIVFVLGGPGCGKGTQCEKIAKHFGFTHLSVGDLLRAETKTGSAYGAMIQTMMKEGEIVPSEVVVKLLQQAMLRSGNNKFLIDGFPRNEENRLTYESVVMLSFTIYILIISAKLLVMKIEPAFILFLDCPQEEMERRVLNRNQGRDDDNIEAVRKRFKVFSESTLPVIEYYERKGKVRKVDAAKPIDEVFNDVKAIFAPYKANFVSSSNFNAEAGVEHRMCPALSKRLARCARKTKALFRKRAPV